jgi:hypothetical protein
MAFIVLLLPAWPPVGFPLHDMQLGFLVMDSVLLFFHVLDLAGIIFTLLASMRVEPPSQSVHETHSV